MKKEIVKEYEKIIKMAKENIELVSKEELTSGEKTQMGANMFDIRVAIDHIHAYMKLGEKNEKKS